MKWLRGPRGVAVVGLLVLSLASPSSASRSLSDAEARVRLEEMEKRGILRDVAWAQAFWLRALDAPTRAATVSDLRWALRFDPEFTQARWKLCRTLARSGDPEFATEALAGVAIGFRSFLAQQRAVYWILTVFGGALAATLLGLSAASIGRALPRVRHGIWERLQFLPPEVRTGATILTLLLPLAVVFTLPCTAAVFWAVLLGTTATWANLERAERRICVGSLLLILAAPVAFAFWARVTDIASPDSYLRNLWVVQGAGADEVHGLTSPPPSAVQDPDYHASLALIERRAGRYEDATAWLSKALAATPSRWGYHNNLGNLRLLQGDADGALEAYGVAASLAPSEPLIYVNEAQAWVRKLEFRRADDAFARASALGYRLSHMLTTEPTDIIVRDRTLSARDLWRRFLLLGDVHVDAVPSSRVAQMVLAPILPMRPPWLAVPLFLVLYYVARTRRLPPVHTCVGCGSSICRKCHYRANRKSYCARCFAIRQEIRAPLKREEMLEERRRKASRTPWATGLVLSIVFPGVGQWVRGALGPAIALALTASALALVATAGFLWPDPSLHLARETPVARTLTAGVLFALLSAVSLRAYLRPRPSETAVGLGPSRGT